MSGIQDILITATMLMASLLVVIYWYKQQFPAQPRSFLRIMAFPFYHFREVLNLPNFPSVFPIFFCYLYFADTLLSLLNISSVSILVLEWSLFVAFETFLISIYWLGLKKSKSLTICFLMIVMYVLLGDYLTIHLKTWQVQNAFDFGECFYLLLASTWIVFRIIHEEGFERDLVAFFVFFGVILYSSLQIISTIIMAFDFSQNEDFSFIAVIITFLFWLLAVPWIHRLRYKLTSPFPLSSSLPSSG
jgi:hypothetical protein